MWGRAQDRVQMHRNATIRLLVTIEFCFLVPPFPPKTPESLQYTYMVSPLLGVYSFRLSLLSDSQCYSLRIS